VSSEVGNFYSVLRSSGVAAEAASKGLKRLSGVREKLFPQRICAANSVPFLE
jgi:hypothetical protein